VRSGISYGYSSPRWARFSRAEPLFLPSLMPPGFLAPCGRFLPLSRRFPPRTQSTSVFVFRVSASVHARLDVTRVFSVVPFPATRAACSKDHVHSIRDTIFASPHRAASPFEKSLELGVLIGDHPSGVTVHPFPVSPARWSSFEFFFFSSLVLRFPGRYAASIFGSHAAAEFKISVVLLFSGSAAGPTSPIQGLLKAF